AVRGSAAGRAGPGARAPVRRHPRPRRQQPELLWIRRPWRGRHAAGRPTQRRQHAAGHRPDRATMPAAAGHPAGHGPGSRPRAGSPGQPPLPPLHRRAAAGGAGQPTRKRTTRYAAADIEVLCGLGPVRRRPGMYTDASRPNHLAPEVVDNAVDEALAGHANKITVTVYKDGSLSVEDNGRGMPVDIHPEYGKNGIAIIMIQLHSIV